MEVADHGVGDSVARVDDAALALLAAAPILSGLGLPTGLGGQFGGLPEDRFYPCPPGLPTEVFVADGRRFRRPTPIARPKNPRRQAAGKRNQALRRGLSEAGRDRLREAVLNLRPWELSTGPRSVAGKAIAAANGKRRQKGRYSVRELRQHRQALEARLEPLKQARRTVLATLSQLGRSSSPPVSRSPPGMDDFSKFSSTFAGDSQVVHGGSTVVLREAGSRATARSR